MSVPITAGVVLYKGYDTSGPRAASRDGFGGPFFWGIVASGITGWFAVWGPSVAAHPHLRPVRDLPLRGRRVDLILYVIR